MIAEDVLAELRRRGVQVEARGDVLHVEAPRGLLSPELVQSLRRCCLLSKTAVIGR